MRSQSVAELLLLPVSENGRPPYRNSTSSFDFDLFIVMGIVFWIGRSNFIQISQRTTELWSHVDFSRWRPYIRKSASGFGFSNSTLLGMSKSICTPNFGETFQSKAELLLLSVSKKEVCHVETILPVLILNC